MVRHGPRSNGIPASTSLPGSPPIFEIGCGTSTRKYISESRRAYFSPEMGEAMMIWTLHLRQSSMAHPNVPRSPHLSPNTMDRTRVATCRDGLPTAKKCWRTDFLLMAMTKATIRRCIIPEEKWASRDCSSGKPVEKRSIVPVRSPTTVQIQHDYLSRVEAPKSLKRESCDWKVCWMAPQQKGNGFHGWPSSNALLFFSFLLFLYGVWGL
jgi:hypothetical protein